MGQAIGSVTTLTTITLTGAHLSLLHTLPDQGRYYLSLSRVYELIWTPCNYLVLLLTLVLVGLRVAEPGCLSRLSADEPVEIRALLVLATLLDGVALRAGPHENLLSLLDVVGGHFYAVVKGDVLDSRGLDN